MPASLDRIFLPLVANVEVNASGRGWLDGATPAAFVFPGELLRRTGIDEPYTLTDLYITNLERWPETHFFVDAHTTAPYQATQLAPRRSHSTSVTTPST